MIVILKPVHYCNGMYITFETMVVGIWLPFRLVVVFIFQAVLVLLNNNSAAVGSLSEARSILLAISE